jgi:hypothetical protein
MRRMAACALPDERHSLLPLLGLRRRRTLVSWPVTANPGVLFSHSNRVKPSSAAVAPNFFLQLFSATTVPVAY